MITDRYLESLLAFEAGQGDDAPAPADLDPTIRRAAALLSRDLPRLHPSFRFEERLAARLAEVGTGMRFPTAVRAEGVVVPLVHRHGADGPDPVDLFLPLGDTDPFRGGLEPLDRSDRVRPFIIGGALTSAAISLAGAAYVAWRRTRPPTTPMARAVRAVARGRLS
jgi:hypothetical protein